jgi:predicted outer membrane repeat protein
MSIRFPLILAAVIAAVAAMTDGVQPAPAAAASPVSVPCSTTALASAMTAAVGGETIRLTASCDYVLTAALPPVSASLTIAGRGATLERSTAPGTPDFALLDVSTGNADLSVSSLTFRNGGVGAIDITGREQLNNNVTVTRSIFTGNTGGALNLGPYDAFVTAQAAATITSSVFAGNSGGGVNANGFVVTVTGSTFTGNTGGGINTQEVQVGRNTLTGGVTVIRSTFTRNTGGGIACNPDETCVATVIRSVFTGNSGSGINAFDYNRAIVSVTHSVFRCNIGGAGGGIEMGGVNGGTLTATDDIFTGNTATVGGGIYNYEAATLTGDTFTGNSAAYGGAIDNEWHATATDTAFRRNKASTNGGAIYQDNYFGDGTLSIVGGRIAGNTAGGDGGGVYNATPHVGSVASISPSTTVRNNQPDNCAPTGSVGGCTG